MESIDEKGLKAKLREAVKAEGGPQKWADKAGVSIQYVSDVLHGRRAPGQGIYTALGYEKQVRYVGPKVTAG